MQSSASRHCSELGRPCMLAAAGRGGGLGGSNVGRLSSLWEGRRLRPQTVAPSGRGDAPPVGALVREWLDAVFTPSDASEAREREAMERLRADPTATLEQLADAYRTAPEADYALQWALVYAAGQLRHPDAVDFLREVLAAPLLPERSRDIHHFSTVGEQISQRLQALSGVAGLATSDDRALGVLLDQLQHDNHAVRVIACQLLTELPSGRASVEDIRGRLPADADADEILSIRRMPVEQLVAPEVERSQRQMPAPPMVDAHAGPRQSTRRPPTIQGED